MKWFKHETEAHLNLKLQSVINNHGLEAYGYYWALVELVGLQGTDYKIKGQKEWKIYLKKLLEIELNKQEQFLTYFSEKGLIDNKSFQAGDLFMPKLRDRSDDYTNKVRRRSGQDTDNVSLDKNKTDKNKTKQMTLYTENDTKLAELLLELIRQNTPTYREPNINNWSDDIRKMRELDGRTEKQIEYLIRWCQQDSFWKANILSTNKLREKFDQLVAKIKSTKDTKKKGHLQL